MQRKWLTCIVCIIWGQPTFVLSSSTAFCFNDWRPFTESLAKPFLTAPYFSDNAVRYGYCGDFGLFKQSTIFTSGLWVCFRSFVNTVPWLWATKRCVCYLKYSWSASYEQINIDIQNMEPFECNIFIHWSCFVFRPIAPFPFFSTWISLHCALMLLHHIFWLAIWLCLRASGHFILV